jgi:hypothetical protein
MDLFTSVPPLKSGCQAGGRPGTNVIKLFTTVIVKFYNKLERLSLAGLSSLFYCLRVRPGAYPRVEHLKDVSLGQAPSLPARTEQSWKGLPVANALAYYENL